MCFLSNSFRVHYLVRLLNVVAVIGIISAVIIGLVARGREEGVVPFYSRGHVRRGKKIHGSCCG